MNFATGVTATERRLASDGYYRTYLTVSGLAFRPRGIALIPYSYAKMDAITFYDSNDSPVIQAYVTNYSNGITTSEFFYAGLQIHEDGFFVEGNGDPASFTWYAV